MVDFSLRVLDSFGLLVQKEEVKKVRATNREAFTYYGLQLSPDDCEMLVQSAQQSMRENDLVAVGASITPRLIHWFLQECHFGRKYALEVAELTDVFYRVKSELQCICEENDQTECMLSDNAILFYMYRFYTCPSCSGDADSVMEYMSQIIIPAMNRLVHRRNKQKKAQLDSLTKSAKTALYADQIMQHQLDDEYEIRSDGSRKDDLFRRVMLRDAREFGCATGDNDAETENPFYDSMDNLYGAYDDEQPVFGTFPEELDALLKREPELLLPSEQIEQEWDDMAERWEEQDAAVANLYQ